MKRNLSMPDRLASARRYASQRHIDVNRSWTTVTGYTLGHVRPYTSASCQCPGVATLGDDHHVPGARRP